MKSNLKECEVCKEEFKPQATTQKFCSAFCFYKKGKKMIKNNSSKRALENKAYSTLRRVFLDGKICPITGQQATQIHHKKGRIGKLLNDVSFWLAVSDEGHKKIEQNPIWAKENGYSISRLK